jgi:hypothetical protein
MKLHMNLAIGRLGHEVSGLDYVTHEEANRLFDESVGNTGVLWEMKQTYISIKKYFSHNSRL